jgi:N-glycosylase/DNA lyase
VPPPRRAEGGAGAGPRPRRSAPRRLGSGPLTRAKARFDLDLVVRSHGWYDLPSFDWDAEERRLRFVFLEGEIPLAVEVTEQDGGLQVTTTGDGTEISFCYAAAANAAADRSQSVTRAGGVKGPRPLRGARSAPLTPPARVLRVLSRVLDLSSDLSRFHALCRSREGEGFGWIARRGAGRILRAPTAFEDAVKVLLTTNCSWGLTRAMVKNLVDSFGRGGAFPHPAFVASFTEKRLRDEIRCGYRATSLLRLADSVASGRLDLASWEDPARGAEEVEAEIGSQHGFGPYAVQTISRLLGRHGKLGLDSWSRKKIAEIRFRGRRVPDARIERLYRPFGEFAGLAFWLDVTREWHDGRERLWP